MSRNEYPNADPKRSDVASKLLRDSNIQDFDIKQLTGKSRLDALDTISAESLANLIKDEDLSVQALVLAHIDARKSFETLEALPVRVRSQILGAISKLNPTPPGVIEHWNHKFKEKLKT